MEKGLARKKIFDDCDIIGKMNAPRSRIEKFEAIAIFEKSCPDIEAWHAPGMKLVWMTGTDMHERTTPPDTNEFVIRGQPGHRCRRHEILLPDELEIVELKDQ